MTQKHNDFVKEAKHKNIHDLISEKKVQNHAKLFHKDISQKSR